MSQGGLRTSATLYGRGEDSPGTEHSAPNSTPSSPRGSLNSSIDEPPFAESFASWESVPTPEHLLTWRAAPVTSEASALPPPLIALQENSLWRIENGPT